MDGRKQRLEEALTKTQQIRNLEQLMSLLMGNEYHI
jgi:hypothetical protein